LGRPSLGLCPYTDDLKTLTEEMRAKGTVALDHNYGLWYDRRRDDHQRVRRMDGEVWPPFFEQPFARSGLGLAWDGLSRYDLSKYNPWYWNRLREFAAICDREGLLLFHQNYFQHNIIEAGAHWADSPWRTANNINNTDFPEPPPYAGDKRIFMAEQFYDVTHLSRRKLHRDYIRKCLDNFAGELNVIQFTSAEYTGPLEFVEFWLDTISDWQRETKRQPLVALSCTKDVQDAILADPSRSQLINVIDFKYWWITDKGLFAPKGGLSLAPRQFERQWKGGRPNDENLAEMTVEYRRRHPDKAVICDFSAGAWAFLCAGGSTPNLPATSDQTLLSAVPLMQPWPEASSRERWVLRERGRQYLVYCGPNARPELDLSKESRSPLLIRKIDLGTGKLTAAPESVVGGQIVKLPPVKDGPSVLWLVHQL
jgi:hypothetical protein